ncbi:hypothetical protein AT05_03285 [Schleiferia thermophila str. Yellowstone]|nr:hypothetical protein AT05_03285 [Schleiferia thermophila str. Yellowstone]
MNVELFGVLSGGLDGVEDRRGLVGVGGVDVVSQGKVCMVSGGVGF